MTFLSYVTLSFADKKNKLEKLPRHKTQFRKTSPVLLKLGKLKKKEGSATRNKLANCAYANTCHYIYTTA